MTNKCHWILKGDKLLYKKKWKEKLEQGKRYMITERSEEITI